MSGSKKDREENAETVKATKVVTTAHARGLLVTFTHSEDRHLQVVISREQVLRMARDILSVMYSMGMKVE